MQVHLRVYCESVRVEGIAIYEFSPKLPSDEAIE